MIITMMVVFGLCLGSFVNALVWRLHEQETEHAKKKSNKQRLQDLSISKGRSMCPHCGHELSAWDLIPVLSWVFLRGKCRYCRAPISIQYPVAELITAALFVVSYLWWPYDLHGLHVAAFVLWLPILTGLMALVVYDLHWMLLPNRIMYPLGVFAGVFAVITIAAADEPVRALVMTLLAVALGGGIFYVLFQISGGKWIGGGDVKLGWLLGLLVGTPALSFLFIFAAALLGTLYTLPLLLKGSLKVTKAIPFGPFLIAGAIIAQLYGTDIIDWYKRFFIIQ
jgi:prepilin signal peptidase PulO-like enzyme (type II secretory pathway)